MGSSGSVAWMFDKKGVIVIEDSNLLEDDLMEIVLDSGAEDIIDDNGILEVVISPESIDNAKEAIKEANIEISSANVTVVPKNFKRVDGKEAEKVLKLMEFLDDHDDVQNVYNNYDIDDEIMKSYQ